MKDFAQLKSIRERLNLTQAQMCGLLGINRSYLAELESERRPMQDWILAKAKEVERRMQGVALTKKHNEGEEDSKGFEDYKASLPSLSTDEIAEIADYITNEIEESPRGLLPVYQAALKAAHKEVVRRVNISTPSNPEGGRKSK